jgi:glycosyltransferase involved in cell wall biosynthesis
MKKHVVLASILKPVDDTRMYKKMARCLAGTNRFRVSVVGAGQHPAHHPNIQTKPLGDFGRLSLKRLLAPWRVLLFCFKVKPDVFVATTHELLLVAIANRILFGAKIWYDVQENYYRNIRFGGVFPAWLAPALAGWVRTKERLLMPFFTGAWAAEKCYPEEMPFLKKAVVIENKALPPALPRRPKSGRPFTFLFSGTLASTTGVFRAVDWVEEIHAIDPAVRLVVAGFCIRESEQKKLIERCAGKSFIELRGITRRIPHTQIEQAIAEADAGIVAYPPSPHTANRIPTKLYEYLAWRVPVVCTAHPVWSELVLRRQAGVITDFSVSNAAQVWADLRHNSFYPQVPDDVYWHNEAPKLLACLDG